MAPRDRDSSTRFHPYDSTKKPRVHRTNISKHSNNSSKRSTNSNDTPQKTGLSINDLKRRIRDVKRLLSHADLSPEARIVQERALAGYEKDLKEEQERRQRSEMIKKYHFVRFLDRKAATKELRTAQLRLEKAKDEQGKDNGAKVAKLQADVDMAQVNVNYTIYYPLTEKYISLYPQDRKRQGNEDGEDETSDNDDDNDNDNDGDGDGDGDGADEETRSRSRDQKTKKTDEKPPMWHIVKNCMSENTLEQLREGKLNIRSSEAVAEDGGKGYSAKGAENPKKRERDSTDSKHYDSKKKKPVQAEIEKEEEDSDGGFFEE